jgi:hypothetical protein
MSNETNPPQSLPPFEKLDKSLTKQIGIGIYRLAVLLLCVGNFWLAKTYVNKDDFEAMKEKNTASVLEMKDKTQTTFAKVNEDLVDIKFTLKMMTQVNLQMQDHEARIRVLEKGK